MKKVLVFTAVFCLASCSQANELNAIQSSDDRPRSSFEETKVYSCRFTTAFNTVAVEGEVFSQNSVDGAFFNAVAGEGFTLRKGECGADYDRIVFEGTTPCNARYSDSVIDWRDTKWLEIFQTGRNSIRLYQSLANVNHFVGPTLAMSVRPLGDERLALAWVSFPTATDQALISVDAASAICSIVRAE